METVNSPPTHLPFAGPVRLARLVGRRKRFFMDVEDAGGPFVAHTNNTGSMRGLIAPGREVLLSESGNPARKLPCTVEMIRLGPGPDAPWAGVNTMVPNRLLKAAWRLGLLAELSEYERFHPEPAFAGGRLDARLDGPRGTLWVETKNVSLVEDGLALFPDAPTSRGSKHLVELTRLAAAGARAALFCLVQRPDGARFAPARAIDPAYADLFWRAVDAGVEIWPFRAVLSERGVSLGERLPLAGP